MIAPDVRRLVKELQQALGVSVACGQVTLNINQGDVDSVDVRTKVRVPPRKALDMLAKQAQA
jgi:hypothetical protein